MSEEKSLVDDLLSRTSVELRTKCGLTRLRESMSPEEAEALDRAMEMIRQDNNLGRAKVYSCEWLTSVLNRHGHSISSSTIARHITRRCGCE